MLIAAGYRIAQAHGGKPDGSPGVTVIFTRKPEAELTEEEKKFG